MTSITRSVFNSHMTAITYKTLKSKKSSQVSLGSSELGSIQVEQRKMKMVEGLKSLWGQVCQYVSVGGDFV